MSKWVIDIHGELEGDYEIIKEYEESNMKQLKTTVRDLPRFIAKSDGTIEPIKCDICSIGKIRTEIKKEIDKLEYDMSKDILSKEIDEGIDIGLHMALDIVNKRIE